MLISSHGDGNIMWERQPHIYAQAMTCSQQMNTPSFDGNIILLKSPKVKRLEREAHALHLSQEKRIRHNSLGKHAVASTGTLGL